MISEERNHYMANENHTQFLERVYDNDELQNSVFEPYYADAHKIITTRRRSLTSLRERTGIKQLF